MPKQFLPLVGERSTYQQALLRVADSELFAPPIVMTSANFRFFARRQAENLGIAAKVVLEPERRESGPAIAAAAVLARQRDPEAVVLTLAADHVILDEDRFRTACRTGRDAALAGHIVTFGIRPSEPRTAYGYIRPGDRLCDGLSAVAAFVEKPDLATAVRYVADGYLWNSGNFLFHADNFLSELARYEPEMVTAAEAAVAEAKLDLDFLRLGPAAFAKAPKKSIDYAMMEKTSRAAVVEGQFRWSDIGSWDAVYDVSDRNGSGNALHGSAIAYEAKNCLVHADGQLTAIVGADDLVVVTTPDVVLVMRRSRAEQVREVVSDLKARGRSEATDHRRVYRPWGHYESVDAGERFQVKRIVVSPGSRLSLQRHLHRAEHWVVVRGTARVTIGDVERVVHENESIYVPIGAIHRLANPGKIPLELIEVQTGSYLGEDDIERLDDIYGRS